MSLNIFQIWDSLGRKTPFAVRRGNWRPEFYAVVERVECEKMPYGKAFGYSVHNGIRNDHFSYDKNWRKERVIPNCGSYQWSLVENVDIKL